jgi:hypothetical protein
MTHNGAVEKKSAEKRELMRGCDTTVVISPPVHTRNIPLSSVPPLTLAIIFRKHCLHQARQATRSRKVCRQGQEEKRIRSYLLVLFDIDICTFSIQVDFHCLPIRKSTAIFVE